MTKFLDNSSKPVRKALKSRYIESQGGEREI